MLNPMENIKLVAKTIDAAQMETDKYPKVMECEVYINGELATNVKSIEVKNTSNIEAPVELTMVVTVKDIEIEFKED